MSRLNYNRFKRDNYKRDSAKEYYSDFREIQLGRNNLNTNQKRLISEMYFSKMYKALPEQSKNIIKSCLGKKYLSNKQKNALNVIYSKYYIT